jgi:hypothetical protein
MKRLICGLAAAASLLASTGVRAQPIELSSPELDQVNAGFLEIDTSNTSYVVISIFQRPYMMDWTGNSLTCQGCYLMIDTPTIAVGARFGP